MRLGKCEEALACAQEAALLSPASHHVMYLVLRQLNYNGIAILIIHFGFILIFLSFPLAWPHSRNEK